MITRRPFRGPMFMLLLLALGVAAGCVKIQQLRPESSRHTGCRLLMIYGGGPSRPLKDAPEKHSMVVYFEMSDSTYEFGHLSPQGGFEGYVSGVEGRLRITGGETRDFAIRALTPEATMYPLEKYGSCEFGGPPMRASQAIFPPREEPYYSITRFLFVPHGDSVMVELTTSSPNGFGLADS